MFLRHYYHRGTETNENVWPNPAVSPTHDQRTGLSELSSISVSLWLDVLRQRSCAVAQYEFLYLARGVFRQVAEQDTLWRLEVRHALAREGYQLAFGRRGAGLERDERNGHFSPFRIGTGDHCGFHHRRMAAQRALDFDRGDVLPARYDDVLGAVLQLDVPVGMHHPEVAGPEPPVGDRLAGGDFVLVVAQHDVVAAQRDLPEGAGVRRHVFAAGIDDAQLLRDHVANALARLDLRLLDDREPVPLAAPLADRGRTERFGESVEVGDFHAELGHALQDRRRRWRAANRDPHRARQLRGARIPRQHD